jgi:hypothetical protein
MESLSNILGLEYSSSCRVPAYQEQNHNFKLQHHQKISNILDRRRTR